MYRMQARLHAIQLLDGDVDLATLDPPYVTSVDIAR